MARLLALTGVAGVFYLLGSNRMSETAPTTDTRRYPEILNAVYDDLTTSITAEKERQWDITKWALLSGIAFLAFYYTDIASRSEYAPKRLLFTILIGLIMMVIGGFSTFLITKSIKNLNMNRNRLTIFRMALPLTKPSPTVFRRPSAFLGEPCGDHWSRWPKFGLAAKPSCQASTVEVSNRVDTL